MEKYWNIFTSSFSDYGNYLWREMLHPSWGNYFYWLLGLSLFFWLLEVILPWRKGQPVIRQDFWLDGFYMFFNFFLFSLVGFNAISNIGVEAFNDFLGLFGIQNLIAFEIQSWPVWAQLLTLFVLRDFIQWNVHRLLHRSDFLWRFHKVHHSVQQMGFAAHLRFHWGETVVYRTLEYIPLAMIGFGIQDFFLVHIFATAIGHFNHSNLHIPLGPLRYLFNNPQMHIWHHAKRMPHRYGANYGISLSVWDYLFGTAYMPQDGRDIELGFEEVEQYPKSFFEQQVYPFRERAVVDDQLVESEKERETIPEA
ncbi:sterol desaturase family protein [Pontibacter lucknowensis]|uniref:Sterol desaturase/sphingolipid hydroxylase, fatty acid hydroxylase superfamily n=1 Tax=Pontibacter lucknowensis TaxID=1077936 RepID=A0A1N6XIH4_9BACT|nr:sterol desaturase family protein [Pontibacter lucknowensis]SIR02093.1 Sterol desaturase/sphingolipid hydroxylase, fatty acid hydroxylase superfamily [Pontibacter lucknowensis]